MSKAIMSQAIIIEISGTTAGIVVGSPGNFRFFSSEPAFDRLDGRTFHSAEQARRTAAVHRTAQDHRKDDRKAA
ncbi:hypothetical protein LJR009_004064 [Bosea sp. LjRoot9]|uniref:hypothetical protein n=1 Tax=Bosea sp. LjRoot9 TaxID=3342341 RepID=UPI003ECEB011